MTGKLLSFGAVANLIGVSRATLYRRIADGSFPRPVQVGPRSVRFLECDIAAWVDALRVSALPKDDEN